MMPDYKKAFNILNQIAREELGDSKPKATPQEREDRSRKAWRRRNPDAVHAPRRVNA